MNLLITLFNRWTAWLRKDSRLVIRNNPDWPDSTIYSVRMATPDPQTKTSSTIDKNTDVRNFPELTGADDVSFSLDWLQDILQGIDSLFEMDVYARCQQVNSRGDNIGDGLVASVYNPTVGCPFFRFQSTDGFYYSRALDENTGVDFMLNDGRTVSVRREGDTDVKEWRVDIG
jgi:hypothetical protein